MPTEAHQGDLQCDHNSAKKQKHFTPPPINWHLLVPRKMARCPNFFSQVVGSHDACWHHLWSCNCKAIRCINKGDCDHSRQTIPEEDGALWGVLCSCSNSSAGQRWLCSTHAVPLWCPRWGLKRLPWWHFAYNMCFSSITVCRCSSVCVWGNTLLHGWHLDGQQMYAVHLPAPSWCGLLWDVCIWSLLCHCWWKAMLKVFWSPLPY